jgi:putative acetyltransferase
MKPRLSLIGLPRAHPTGEASPVIVQRETSAHTAAIHTVTTAAFTRSRQPHQTPAEATLVDELRASDAWLPTLSLVAVDSDGDGVVGHVLGSRAHVDSAPVVALGPLSVHPDHQGRGVGLALMHAVLGAADALDEPVVVLLGDPQYYSRFGFRLAEEYGITPAVPEWRPYFQARTLTAFSPAVRGQFTYAEPFDRV